MQGAQASDLSKTSDIAVWSAPEETGSMGVGAIDSSPGVTTIGARSGARTPYAARAFSSGLRSALVLAMRRIWIKRWALGFARPVSYQERRLTLNPVSAANSFWLRSIRRRIARMARPSSVRGLSPRKDIVLPFHFHPCGRTNILVWTHPPFIVKVDTSTFCFRVRPCRFPSAS